MPSTLFGRLAVFVLILVGLRALFGWQISIVGSLLVTFLVYAITGALESRSEHRTNRDQKGS